MTISKDFLYYYGDCFRLFLQIGWQNYFNIMIFLLKYTYILICMRRNVRFKNFDLCLGSGYMCFFTLFCFDLQPVLKKQFFKSIISPLCFTTTAVGHFQPWSSLSIYLGGCHLVIVSLSLSRTITLVDTYILVLVCVWVR